MLGTSELVRSALSMKRASTVEGVNMRSKSEPLVQSNTPTLQTREKKIKFRKARECKECNVARKKS